MTSELPDYADVLQVVNHVLRLIDEKVMLTKAREGRASDRKRAEAAEQAYILMCGHGKAIREALNRRAPEPAGREVSVPPKAVFHSSGGTSGFNDYNCGGRIITMSVAEAQAWNNCIDEVLRINATPDSTAVEMEALERNLVDAMNMIHRCDKSRERWMGRAVKMRHLYRDARDLLMEVRDFMDNEDIDWHPIGKPPLLQRINDYLRRLSRREG